MALLTCLTAQSFPKAESGPEQTYTFEGKPLYEFLSIPEESLMLKYTAQRTLGFSSSSLSVSVKKKKNSVSYSQYLRVIKEIHKLAHKKSVNQHKITIIYGKYKHVFLN